MNSISKMFASVLVLTVVWATEGLCSAPDDEQTIRSIIEDVRQGWLNADGAPFREHFLDFEGARYFEGGGENTGLVDLIEHHVEPEADAFDGFKLNFNNIQVHVEGAFAWALVDTEIKAIVRESARIIDNRGHATYLFRKVDDSWKVIHTHSASRPVRRQESGH